MELRSNHNYILFCRHDVPSCYHHLLFHYFLEKSNIKRWGDQGPPIPPPFLFYSNVFYFLEKSKKNVCSVIKNFKKVLQIGKSSTCNLLLLLFVIIIRHLFEMQADVPSASYYARHSSSYDVFILQTSYSSSCLSFTQMINHLRSLLISSRL